ncbi:MAG: 2-C-methyl-D-erythritol 4-phosphate cytidylyltransferase [Actinomycetota bacterium]
MSDVQRSGSSTEQRGTVWTIVVAGGSGRRFGSMKQFEELGGRRVIDHAVTTALACSDGVVVVVPDDDVGDERRQNQNRADLDRSVIVVGGGPTRTASVRNGLRAVADSADIVLVHDAARPFASVALFESVIHAVVSGADGAIPGLPMVDTVKVIEVSDVERVGAVVPRVTSTPDRATLVSVQTPQGFRADVLRRAYESEIDSTDDSALVEAIGGTVIVVPGEADNRKITHIEDLAWARNVLAEAADSPVQHTRSNSAQSHVTTT